MAAQKKRFLVFSARCFVVLLTASCCYANAGIPIVAIQLPAYFVSVWLESAFVRKQVQERKINPKRLMDRVNLFSYALLVSVWSLQLYFNLLQGDEVSLLPYNLA
ncbi:MAG: hypothetical protein D3925_01865 [Candidatus Electrothrix sp. AR5]|nr:hypothetical protein [Candidatus Electrothrix sp. AR5]